MYTGRYTSQGDYTRVLHLSGRHIPGCYTSQGGYTRVLFSVILLREAIPGCYSPLFLSQGGYTRVLFTVIPFLGGLYPGVIPVISPLWEAIPGC